MSTLTTASETNETVLNRRMKLYPKDQLKTVQDAFLEHFKVKQPGGPGYTDITSSKVSIALHDMHRVALLLLSRHRKPVRGIHFEYGADGSAFSPVIRFMYADDDDKGDLKLFPELYEVSGKELKDSDEARRAVLTDSYRENVLINSGGVSGTRAITTSGEEPDPLAEWFPYADNVNRLIADNRTATELVVSCISEPLPYSAMALTAPVPEYRHMLALHMADEHTDLLLDDEPTLRSGYANLAMDLGHLCPPRCKRP